MNKGKYGLCLVHCAWSIVPGMVLVRVLALSLYKGVALLFQVEHDKAVLGL